MKYERANTNNLSKFRPKKATKNRRETLFCLLLAPNPNYTMLGLGRSLKNGLSRRGTTLRVPKRAVCTKTPWSKDSVDLSSTVNSFADQSPNKLKNMLFCHGLFGSGSNWRAIASSLQSKVRQKCSSISIPFFSLLRHFLTDNCSVLG